MGNISGRLGQICSRASDVDVLPKDSSPQPVMQDASTIATGSMPPVEPDTDPNGQDTRKREGQNVEGLFINARELNRVIRNRLNRRRLRIFDVTAGGTGFAMEHIPGALYLDLYNGVEHTDYVPRNIPARATFQTNMRNLGINQDSVIVLYDRTSVGAGFFQAGRGWALFKYFGHENVSVLDGGFAKWKEGGYQTERGPTSPILRRGNFRAIPLNGGFIKTLDDIRQNFHQRTSQVVDVRFPTDYQTSHIPRAINFPYTPDIIDTEIGLFRTKEEILTRLDMAGIELRGNIIAYCKGGVVSCMMLMALALVDHPDCSLYLGGWTEFEAEVSPEEMDQMNQMLQPVVHFQEGEDQQMDDQGENNQDQNQEPQCGQQDQGEGHHDHQEGHDHHDQGHEHGHHEHGQ